MSPGTLETAFLIVNAAVLPAWILLVFAPRSALTDNLVHSALYPIFFGVLYTGLMFYALVVVGLPEGASFLTLEGVKVMFASPLAVLIGWVHYLIFDLFVGAWIARDTVRRGVSAPIRVAALVLTFLVGPIGLWLYLTARWATGKGPTHFLEQPQVR